MFDARVWLIWALATLVTASSTRNPLYIIVLLLTTTVVSATCPEGEGRRAPLSPLRFATFAVPLSTVFNALTVHFGHTVLFRLPDWLPLMGGTVTLEAMSFGAVNGLTLTVIFSAFSVFNQVTPVRDLIRLAPRAFHEGGVVLSIALTFIPQTARSLNRIRDAQAVRGHRVRGVRDWVPIVVPLLVSGLERAMGLAEAMVARGYGAVSDEAQPVHRAGVLVLGLLALLGGWLAYLFRPAWQTGAVAMMIVGAALVGVVVWVTGRGVRHTVYRERRWTLGDSLVLAGCALTLAITLTQSTALQYSPYPRLELPPFAPIVGLGMLGLLVPAVVTLGQETTESHQTKGIGQQAHLKADNG